MKFSDVTVDLRRRIAEGEFSPGEQLPLRQELLEHYEISVSSFQKVVHTLTEEGFLESRGAYGTRVTATPPCRCRVGVLFPSHPVESGLYWDSFWRAFTLAIEQRRRNEPFYSFEFYYNIEAHSEEGPEYRRLVEDIRNRRLMGVVVLEHIRLSPAMEELIGEIPAVFFSERSFPSKNIARIEFDYPGLFDLACQMLAEEGCRRPAVLFNPEMTVEFFPDYFASLKRRGLESRPEWFQAAGLGEECGPWLAQSIRLLFSANQAVRPDGLIVMNENLLPVAQSTLAELGLRHGRNLRVVTHCNLPTRNNLRADGLGRSCFDSAQALELSLKLLEECRTSGGCLRREPVSLPARREQKAMLSVS